MKPLVIENFQKGIAPSVHVGFGQIRNMDLNTFPGIARINNLLEKKSDSVVVDLILWMVINPDNADIWALGDEGNVYKSTNGGSTWTLVAGNTKSLANGNGLAIWKDYLFVARNSLLDVYGPLSGSPSWTDGWKSLTTDNFYHPMITGQDDILYIGAGRYVTSLEESTTFAPGTSSSYVFTSHKLSLPNYYRVKCLTELGQNLEVGTWMGTVITDMKVADIFPWDRNSETATGLPVRLAENGVNAMITVDNVMYALAGVSGRLFVTNGTSIAQVAQIPESIADIEGGKYLSIYPGSMMRHKGKIFFGIGGTSTTNGAGVWSFTPGKENGLALENIISTGHDGSIAGDPVRVGGMTSNNRDSFIVGWRDDITYGIDRLNNLKRYTGYTAFIESPLYSVGTVLAKRTFNTIEVQLVKPLLSNQGVRISYRKNLTDDYDEMFTFDESTMGGKLSYTTDAHIVDAEFVQFKIEMTTGTSNNTPELRRITLP